MKVPIKVYEQVSSIPLRAHYLTDTTFLGFVHYPGMGCYKVSVV